MVTRATGPRLAFATVRASRASSRSAPKQGPVLDAPTSLHGGAPLGCQRPLSAPEEDTTATQCPAIELARAARFDSRVAPGQQLRNSASRSLRAGNSRLGHKSKPFLTRPSPEVLSRRTACCLPRSFRCVFLGCPTARWSTHLRLLPSTTATVSPSRAGGGRSPSAPSRSP